MLDLRFDVTQTSNETFRVTPTEEPFQGGWTKPCEFNSMDEVMSCLIKFGIQRLPEFGAKVVWQSNVSVSDLENAGFLKVRESLKPELLLTESFEHSRAPETLETLGFVNAKKKLCYSRTTPNEIVHNVTLSVRKSRLPENAIGAISVKIEITSPAIKALLSRFLSQPHRSPLCCYMSPIPICLDFYDRQSAVDASDHFAHWFKYRVEPLLCRFDSVHAFVDLAEDNDVSSCIRADTMSLVGACLYLGKRQKALEHFRWLSVGQDTSLLRQALLAVD